jgi:hypothetical protein
MRKKYAVFNQSAMSPTGIIQLDDAELACRLAEATIGNKRPFRQNDADRRFFQALATVALDYIEERAEAARVHYA